MRNIMLIQLIISKGINDNTIKRFLGQLYINKMDDGFLFSSVMIMKERLSINDDQCNSIINNYDRAKQMYDKLTHKGIGIISEIDDAYPANLKRTLGINCPPVLFVKGNIDLMKELGVGFCGSRKVSPKGLMITNNCAMQIVNNCYTVISGYASGTDLMSHKSALTNNGTTIFVLAEGILKATTKLEIRDQLNNRNHLFISQFSPELTWNVGSAMKRNKVIIGLSNAMILVESGKTGGTFAAGEDALKLGRPLFVIDFAKPEVSAEANPYFISKGGIPIRGNKDGVPNLRKLFELLENDKRRDMVIDNSSYIQSNMDL